MPIENVSDTARWVAVYRAMETERPDALFRDPFAAKLAGEKGFEIVKNMKRGKQMAWAMIVRTESFDQIIMGAIREGADMVINLAAGLDARPWRMELPPTLRWVDADLPGILNYKTDLMKGEKPRCRYEAVTIDLTDAAARRALFARLGAEAKRVIVVTEGLLIYLTPEDVASLADALHEQPSFRWWLTDLASPMLLKMMKRMWGRPTAGANAPFRFAPEEGTGFFAARGWPQLSARFSMDEAKRLKREMSGSWFWGILFMLYPKKLQEKFRTMSQFVLLERR
jgi:methyltransferase (TIGR00027 family)